VVVFLEEASHLSTAHDWAQPLTAAGA